MIIKINFLKIQELSVQSIQYKICIGENISSRNIERGLKSYKYGKGPFRKSRWCLKGP